MSADSKKLVMFDLDGTLTKSKSPIDEEMAGLLVKLLKKMKVCIISGGGYAQFETQVLSRLPGTVDNFSNLFLMPTSGTRLYVWKGSWVEKYAENLTKDEKQNIFGALEYALKASGYEKPEKTFGPLIEDRGSQITFSALGQNAPVDVKYAWDPDRQKRKKIVEIAAKKIPGFDVRIGGATSVDVTRRGINKAYGIRKLENFLSLGSDDIIFVGDALFFGGNDYPARATGVDCVQVKDPEETKKFIAKIVE